MTSTLLIATLLIIEFLQLKVDWLERLLSEVKLKKNVPAPLKRLQ